MRVVTEQEKQRKFLDHYFTLELWWTYLFLNRKIRWVLWFAQPYCYFCEKIWLLTLCLCV